MEVCYYGLLWQLIGVDGLSSCKGEQSIMYVQNTRNYFWNQNCNKMTKGTF